MTPTERVLALHTDVANLKTYGTTAPAVTRALIAEAEAKINAINDHITCVRRSLLAAEAPRGWDKVEAGTDQAA